jgi:predicted O-methyltransferase YrrM
MKAMPTAKDYAEAFEAERLVQYPMVDAFEAKCGYAIDSGRLQAAARVLACPIKKSKANWQHGRLIYARVREYLLSEESGDVSLVDIGSAKGFSALCLRWALIDSGRTGRVVSTDVIDPLARVRRNTVAEVDGLKTLAETLAPWPEATGIEFCHGTGMALLERLAKQGTRVHVAFVDGKHTGSVVAEEGRWLAMLQQPGDLAIFDDVHLPDIAKAVKGLSEFYELETLTILPNRAYAVGVRR